MDFTYHFTTADARSSSNQLNNKCCIGLFLFETGMPTLKELVVKRTTAFARKILTDDTGGTPLSKVYEICQEKRTSGYSFINPYLQK